MSMIEVKVPTVGESINEATISRWNFSDGDYVEKDAVIFEIETEKATLEVNAPASGTLKIQSPQGSTVAIGASVGSIDSSASKPAGGTKTESKPTTPPPPPPPAASTSTPQASSEKPSAQTSSPSSGFSQSASTQDLRGLGPAKRKAVREGKMQAPSAAKSTGFFDPQTSEGQRRVPMTTIRKKIAERLMHSQQSTATLTTFNEVDMSAILNVRNQVKEQFQKQFDVKLGFMSFFTKAVVYAVGEVPTVNAYIDGNDIVYNDFVHTGIAVSTDRGLVVPVLRNVNQLSYAEIEKGIAMLAEKARVGKLGVEEMMGGTFTITNGGVFGSLLSTPILNPPQSGILGMHKTEHRPIAVQGPDGKYVVEVRPMMYVALSYDHRIIDGKDSVTFLVKVKEYLENVSVDEVMKG